MIWGARGRDDHLVDELFVEGPVTTEELGPERGVGRKVVEEETPGFR